MANLVRAVSAVSTPGGRTSQEDFALVNRERGVFVVADGFGGPIAGSQASQMAAESVQGFLIKEAGDLEATLPFLLRSYLSLPGNVLFNALVHANRKLLGLNKDRSIHEKGGASVLAAFIDGDLLALANVGACTGWLFRDGKRTELVVPRTYARLCDPFAREIAENDVPLLALGVSEDMEPEIFECRVRPGDWLILHTDGLGAAALDAIGAIQARRGPDAKDPERSIQQATEACSQAPGPDNIAVSLVIF